MMGGANPHETDQELLESVIKKAQEHQITLTPEQVTVQRIGTPGAPAVYVAADYSVPVSLPGYSFTLHFTPIERQQGLLASSFAFSSAPPQGFLDPSTSSTACAVGVRSFAASAAGACGTFGRQRSRSAEANVF